LPLLPEAADTMTRAYCTILSTNYLPKALALAESLRRHEDGAILRILFIDVAADGQLPELAGVECLSTASLGLSRRAVGQLVMSYDLVEFATASPRWSDSRVIAASGSTGRPRPPSTP
jgi:hypothetical protein